MAEAAVIRRLRDDAEDLSNAAWAIYETVRCLLRVGVKHEVEKRGSKGWVVGWKLDLLTANTHLLDFTLFFLTLVWPREAYVHRKRHFCAVQ